MEIYWRQGILHIKLQGYERDHSREWENGEWIVEEHELIEGGDKLGHRIDLIVKGLNLIAKVNIGF